MTNHLVVVGTGIHVGHLTSEVKGWLTCANKVLYCVADAATERLILQLNRNSESLYRFYAEGKRRIETYDQMVGRTLECVRINSTVCVAYYGHPGFFVYPSHRAVKLARAEGHRATMVPGISSLDCLLCDLGIDPSKGCQVFEATDMLLRRKMLDTSGHVVILQVSVLGEMAYSPEGYDRRHLPTLVSYLSKYYPSDFVVKAYYASPLPVAEPVIQEIPIGKLNETKSAVTSTLYIPPLQSGPVHLEMLERVNLTCVLQGTRLVPLNANEEMLLNK